MITSSLKKKGKTYKVTFDEYGDVDTIECGGKFLSTKNAVVKIILNNADIILRGRIPDGFERA